jgi:hypothetical protein
VFIHAHLLVVTVASNVCACRPGISARTLDQFIGVVVGYEELSCAVSECITASNEVYILKLREIRHAFIIKYNWFLFDYHCLTLDCHGVLMNCLILRSWLSWPDLRSWLSCLVVRIWLSCSTLKSWLNCLIVRSWLGWPDLRSWLSWLIVRSWLSWPDLRSWLSWLIVRSWLSCSAVRG